MLGGNAGIGCELVRLLAEKGHIVYLGARNEAAGKEAECVWSLPTNEICLLNIGGYRAKLHGDGLNTVKYVRIDVTDLATIQAAKETIDKAEGKLDVLVNNAGMFFLSYQPSGLQADSKKNIRYR